MNLEVSNIGSLIKCARWRILVSEQEMPIWDDVLTETDRKVIEKAGYGKRRGLGKKPSIVVIDVTLNYVGENVSILESIEKWPASSGERAWKAIPKIKQIIDLAREKKIPIIYTIYAIPKGYAGFDAFMKKTKRKSETFMEGHSGTKVIDQIAPQEGDIVLNKEFASAFFGTRLISFLNELGMDTLLIMGGTTSGCVRGTVVDAVGYGFHVAVVEDCVYDRIDISHKVSLLDISMKYADVMKTEEALDYLRGI